jgi:hypothetical protein
MFKEPPSGWPGTNQKSQRITPALFYIVLVYCRDLNLHYRKNLWQAKLWIQGHVTVNCSDWRLLPLFCQFPSPAVPLKNTSIVSLSPRRYYIYLSGLFDSCRRLPETKRHSSLFLHWSGYKFLVVMAACNPSIHGFLGRQFDIDLSRARGRKSWPKIT